MKCGVIFLVVVPTAVIREVVKVLVEYSRNCLFTSVYSIVCVLYILSVLCN